MSETRLFDNINIMNQGKKQRKTDIKRRILERDDMFNMDTRNDDSGEYKSSVYNKFSSKPNVGEITGANLNIDELEQGMPFRQSYVDSKRLDQSPPTYNPHLDFELYRQDDPQGQSNNSLNYFEQSYPSSVQFSDINSQSTKSTYSKFHFKQQKKENLQQIINRFCIDAFQIYRSVYKTDFSFSPLSIIPFVILYRGSKNETEQELKNFFNFSDNKNTLMSELKNIIRMLEPSIININSILSSQSYDIKTVFKKYMNELCLITNNSQEINTYIKKTTGNLIPYTLTEDMLTNIVPINISVIRLRLNSSPVFYYKDESQKIIELTTNDPDITFGMILSPDPNITSLLANIPKLKKTNTSIAIPSIKEHTKLKLTSLFKKLGLNIFPSCNFSEIYSNQQVVISDIIHQSVIQIDSSSSKKLNKQFIYYVRHIPLNLLLLVGTFLQ